MREPEPELKAEHDASVPSHAEVLSQRDALADVVAELLDPTGPDELAFARRVGESILAKIKREAERK
jgi:hypothetical protein